MRVVAVVGGVAAAVAADVVGDARAVVAAADVPGRRSVAADKAEGWPQGYFSHK